MALKRLTNDITLSAEWDSGIGANDGDKPVRKPSSPQCTTTFLIGRPQARLDYWAPKIVSGEFTASEMAVALIEVRVTLGRCWVKQQAATYYVENVAQDNFSRESAGEAVVDVNGPLTLQSSQEATTCLRVWASQLT